VFRDRLFALYIPDDGGVLQIPFAGAGITNNLLLLNVWLGGAILRDLLYARLGERRITVLLDIATNAAGLFCLLRIVATKQLVDLSSDAATARMGASADTAAAVLNTIFAAIALLTAAILAARLVRRSFRLPQL
jgi:hypothetical protein